MAYPDTTHHIAVEEARIALERLEPTATLEDKLFVALRITAEHWLVCKDSERFSCAVAAVMLSYPENDPIRESLRYEVNVLTALSAPNSAEALAALPPVPSEFVGVGLLKMWKYITGRQL